MVGALGFEPIPLPCQFYRSATGLFELFCGIACPGVYFAREIDTNSRFLL